MEWLTVCTTSSIRTGRIRGHLISAMRGCWPIYRTMKRRKASASVPATESTTRKDRKSPRRGSTMLVILRVCDFFDVVKNRGCKQNSYDDKLVINSKKSQPLSAVFRPAKRDENKRRSSAFPAPLMLCRLKIQS